MSDHRRIEELLSIRALDGLDDDDRALLERLTAEHGETCEECQRLQDDYAEVAGRLAFALAPAELRAGFEDEVVAVAAGTAQRRAAAIPAVAGPSRAPASPDDRGNDRVGRRDAGGVWRWAVAAAAALVIFAGGWLARDVVSPGEPDIADARVVAFDGEGGAAGSLLAIAYRPGEEGAYLIGSRLPPPGPGRVLELWMIRGERVTRGLCLTPGGDGSIAAFVGADLGSASAMAVTVEPDSCPSKPSTDPILTADLPADRTL